MIVKDVRDFLTDGRTIASLLITVAILLLLRINDAPAAVTLFVVSYLLVFAVHWIATRESKKSNPSARPKKGKRGSKRKND